jgi:glutamine amidotransferase
MCRIFALKANNRVDLTFSVNTATDEEQKPICRGLGWYTKEGPALQKGQLAAAASAEPISVGMNSRVVLSHMGLCDTPAGSEKDCQPFIYKQWMFAHDGTLNNAALLHEKLVAKRQASIGGDSSHEIFFHYIVQCIREHDLEAVDGIRTAMRRTEIDGGTRNFVLTNLNTLYAFRDAAPASLYYLERPEGQPFSLRGQEMQTLHESQGLAAEQSVVVASEPLTDDAWKEIPEGYLLVVPNGLECQLVKI